MDEGLIVVHFIKLFKDASCEARILFVLPTKTGISGYR